MDSRVDEALIRRLPLPLARLYRLAHQARTPVDQHAFAVYLWEAILRLLGSVAVVEYLARGEPAPEVKRELTNHLARPKLEHRLYFIRLLLPLLAEHDPHFAAVQAFLLGESERLWPGRRRWWKRSARRKAGPHRKSE
jgi:hypothetical protein